MKTYLPPLFFYNEIVNTKALLMNLPANGSLSQTGISHSYWEKGLRPFLIHSVAETNE